LTKTLQKQVGFVTAKFTQEIKVQADELSALSSQVTTVEATANGATAFGEVYLLAEAAPGGYTAQYGWTLTAGDVSLGMKAERLGTGSFIEYAIMATPSVFLDTPGAGSVTYTASVTNSAGITQVSLIVTELSR
jgi:hypothetical protein